MTEVDRAHERLSGPATRRILQRECAQFGNKQYARLAEISVAHLYNLRASARYRNQAAVFEQTRPSGIAIGERCRQFAPIPAGSDPPARVVRLQARACGSRKVQEHHNSAREIGHYDVGETTGRRLTVQVLQEDVARGRAGAEVVWRLKRSVPNTQENPDRADAGLGDDQIWNSVTVNVGNRDHAAGIPGVRWVQYPGSREGPLAIAEVTCSRAELGRRHDVQVSRAAQVREQDLRRAEKGAAVNGVDLCLRPAARLVI